VQTRSKRLALSTSKICSTLKLSALIRGDNLTVRVFINNATASDEPLILGFGNYYTDNANPTLNPASAFFALEKLSTGTLYSAHNDLRSKLLP